MMSASASVVVVDPNAPAVVEVDPRIIPASGGTIIEIQVKNFPVTSSGVTVSLGNAAAAVAFQVVSAAGSAVSSVRFYSPALVSGAIGYAIRVDGNLQPVVTVAPSSAYAITVSNLIISGQCSGSSIPAFGGVSINCTKKKFSC
jgi:hypothetical protein